MVDLGIEQTRTRDWVVTKVAVRPQRRLGRRSNVHIAGWHQVQGLTPSGLAMPDQGVGQLLEQFEGQRPIEVAEAIRELPEKRRYEVVKALDDERLADVLQELPEDEQADCCGSWRPSARPTCSRRWIPTTPPTCWGR